jgi:hypothetical protein
MNEQEKKNRAAIRKMLRRLNEGEVEYIVVGGTCARVLGLDHPVNDLDIVYRRSYENCRRIAETLRPLHPYPRGLEPDQEVPWNTSIIRDGYSFLIQTDLCDLDLIAELSGGLTFQKIKNRTFEAKAFGVPCRCLNIEEMIYHIDLSGRAKDLRLAARLAKLRDTQARRRPGF